MEEFNKLNEKLQNYPDFYSDQLSYIPRRCNVNREDIDEGPFQRICPNIFKIAEVKYFRQRHGGCYFSVDYTLKDGNDLPKDGRHEALVKLLKDVYPCSTQIVHDLDRIFPPDTIQITYRVYCNCLPSNFDWPAQTSDMQENISLTEKLILS